MGIEDDLRATMRAHDVEAPTAVQPNADVRLSGRTTRRRAWLPIAAAVTCVAGIAIGVSASAGSSRPAAGPTSLPQSTSSSPQSSSSQPPSALTCPEHYDVAAERDDRIWVPALPQGVDGSARLVPVQTPLAAVVCSYTTPTSTQLLTASRRLGEDELTRVADSLASAPRALPNAGRPCTSQSLGTDGDDYLVGLTYAGGTIWVSAPGQHCAGSTNGVFTSSQNLLSVVSAAARGSWPQSGAPKNPCTWARAGRVGDDIAMVPAGAVSVTVCSGQGEELAATSSLSALTRALDALPTRPSQNSCIGTIDDANSYLLFFDYASGPREAVQVHAGCTPEVDNSTLSSDDGSSVLAVIHDLTGQH